LTSRTETRLRIQSAEVQQGRAAQNLSGKKKFNAISVRHPHLTECSTLLCNTYRLRGLEKMTILKRTIVRGGLKKMTVLRRNWSLWFGADDNSPTEFGSLVFGGR